MKELLVSDFSTIAHLIDMNTPNYPIALSVIEKNNPGYIWVDNTVDPRVCLIITDAGYSFLIEKRSVKKEELDKIIALLKNHAPVKLIAENNCSYHDELVKAGFTVIDRLWLRSHALEKSDLSKIDPICRSLPEDIICEPISSVILNKSSWGMFMKKMYGGEEQFFQKGFGLVLLKNGEVLSEAYACFIGGGAVETGSVTAENHRGKGYSTLIRALLIEEIVRRGLIPQTSCHASNEASSKVSKKLGFDEVTRYKFYQYLPSAD